ncbi:MAG: sugar phosphate isomerase/epimerase family protein [Halanaerobiales bacterium]
MEISIWTDIYEELDPDKALDKLLETPFRNFEFSCNHLEYWIEQGKPQKMIDNIKEKLSEYDAKYIQLHAPIFNFMEDEEAEKKLGWCEDALELASKLDIPWVVMHPGTREEGWRGNKDLKNEIVEENVRVYSHLLKVAKEWDTGIALENMFNYRFGARVSELQILLEKLPQSHLGICWDTGHAHIEFENQVPEFKKIQDKIVAVHIADNRGEQDDHLYPLRGKINWEEVLPVLAEKDLPLNYEIPGERAHTPLEIRNHEVEYGYKLGNWLVENYC